MSQENVELIRSLFEAWNAGDMDAFREGYDPDAIMHAVEEFTTIGMVRKGKIVYQEFFWDHAEALEALGASEQDARADA